MTKFDREREKIINTKVGTRLKLVRKQHKISQERLGSMIGVSFQQIQKYENGKDRISAVKLHGFAQIFNVSIYYFFDTSLEAGRSLPKKELGELEIAEAEHIEHSLNQQIQKHINWTCEAIEADVKYRYGQKTANHNYAIIRGASTARILKMTQSVIERFSHLAQNDN